MIIKQFRFPVIVALLLSLLSCDSETSSVLNPDVFDLKTYIATVEDQKPKLKNVQLVSVNGGFSDTIFYSEYPIDSIVHIILGFDFSRRERADEFHINKKETGKNTCTEFKSKKASDVMYLTVCEQGGVVQQISGAKRKKSLLGIFTQSYRFDPKASFELNSTYLDKVQADSLVTTNYMYWN